MREELEQAIKDASGDTAQIASMLGVSRRTAQRWMRNMRKAKEDGLEESGGVIPAPDKRRAILPGTRFVFTTAQNNTKVHMPFFNALRKFCVDKGACMFISKQTYNKSGFQNLGKENEELHYDPVLEPYFHCKSAWIVQDSDRPLVWCGELDILPTAIRPLSGLSTYTREASGIVPHVKMALESVATTPDVPCKMMYTTGAVTQRNYIQRRTGQTADFHHVYGALYVEVDQSGTWFARQLVAAENGSFYDLDTYYSEAEVVHGVRAAAITLGDIHAPKEDQCAIKCAKELLHAVKPECVVLHDLLNFGVRSHWNAGSDHYRMYSQHTSVEKEVRKARLILESLHRAAPDTRIVLAPSNHVQHWQKWLDTGDYRKDPVNSVFFLRCQLTMYKMLASRLTPEQAFWKLVEDELTCTLPKATVAVLRPDDSHRMQSVELGMHGHLGPCGARGNAKNLSKMNVKATIGHTHSACIHDGVYSAGTLSQLDLGYNRGPSNWSHSNVIQYPNGKRAIITIINGKYKA